MRCLLLISLLFLSVPAQAQEIAQAQPYYQQQPPSQQQISDNYAPTVPAYNQPQYAQPQYAQPQPQAAPQHAAQPSDYGQSVITDIRQMNF